MHSKTLTVSQLNHQIRLLLESEIAYVPVEGEISNLKKAASGHVYFTLKDEQSQLRCVFFKNRHSPKDQMLTEGQLIIAAGHISLYEARGDYQLIVESIREAGIGKLFQQFEALKKKLAAEGLFEHQKKLAIPPYPQTIGIITSSHSAAIRDIIATLKRRYPLARLLVFPSEVQGAQASQQLIAALQQAISSQRPDVIIIARGGGSIEDLWGFNNEQLARAIASCPIPVVSGVGHETDVTIVDFVADLRAATPTAAAEAVSPDSRKLLEEVNQYHYKLNRLLHLRLQQSHIRLRHAVQKIASPGQVIRSHWQTIDYLEQKLSQTLTAKTKQLQHHLQLMLTHLQHRNPSVLVKQATLRLSQLMQQLHYLMQDLINKQRAQLHLLSQTLHAVSPLATLDRGYAIASKHEHVLFSSSEVSPGDPIDVRLAKGRLYCKVIKTGES